MRASVLALLGVTVAACGQRGPLYLPTDPAAKGRATLPDLLVPGASTPTTSSAIPAPTPAPSATTTDNPGSRAEGTR